MTVFQKDPALRVQAIHDIEEPHRERALSTAVKAQPNRSPRAHRNLQQLLTDPEIDAVLIATPEHWHARIVLDALSAGKDVYVEQPLCRSPDSYLQGHDLVRAGTLGKVRMVRSWWLDNYLTGFATNAKLEGAHDWEQWQGTIPSEFPSSLIFSAIGATIPPMLAALWPTKVPTSLMASISSWTLITALLSLPLRASPTGKALTPRNQYPGEPCDTDGEA